MSVQRTFAAIGLLSMTTLLLVIVTEASVRLLLKPEIQSDLTVKKSMTNKELCEGATDPYETPGECYSLFDSFAKMTFSTYFGYVPAAGEEGRGYRTNSATMRYDRELAPQKSKGEVRIFVTGGSTAWGAGVAQDQLYSTKAEEILESQFPERAVRVISAGVGGYVSMHEVLRYILYIRPLEPDVWVMFTGWNDIYSSYRGRDHVLSPDMLDLRSAVMSGGKDRAILRERLIGVEGQDIALQQPLWDDYTSKLKWLVDMASYKQRVKLSADSSAQLSAGRMSKGPVQGHDAVELMLTNVFLAARLAHRDGVKLVVMLQPSVYATRKQLAGYESAMVQEAATKYPELDKHFKAAYPRLRQRFKEAAKDEGFIFVDADDAIVGDRRAVFADHVHFGDRGNAAIGSFLAKAVANFIH